MFISFIPVFQGGVFPFKFLMLTRIFNPEANYPLIQYLTGYHSIGFEKTCQVS